MNSLTIAAEFSEMDRARRFLKASFEELNLSEEEAYQIELSMVEICHNIIMYAYPREKGEITLKTWHQGRRLYLEVRDRGIPFDPAKAESPDMEEVLRSGKKGGLGIFLSKKFMDGCNYQRIDDQNVLTMVKDLGNPKA